MPKRKIFSTDEHPQLRQSTPKKAAGASKSLQWVQSSPGKAADASKSLQRRIPPAQKNVDVTRSPKYALKYVFLPSLKHMSGVVIAQSLWMNEKVQRQLHDWDSREIYDYIYRQNDKPEEFRNIEEQVFNNAQQDQVFMSFFSRFSRNLETLKSFIKGIGFEILNWQSFHNDVFCSSISPDRKLGSSAVTNMNCIQWSTTGSIHYEASARNMLAGSTLTDMNKYRLSCVYCWESEITSFGAKVADYITDTRETDGKCAYLIAFWNAKLCSERSDSESEKPEYMLKNYCIDDIPVDHLLYKHSAYANNEAALKYLHEHAPHLQKIQYMDDFFRHGVKSARILYLVLCQLDYKEQKCALKFQKNFLFLLDALLNDWLWIDFFSYTFNCFSNLITNSKFCEFISKLGNNLIGDKSTVLSEAGIYASFARSENYHKMLTEVWTCITARRRTYMFDSSQEADSRFVNNVLPYLDYQENVEILQHLLSDVDRDTRETIAYTDCNMKKCTLMLIMYNFSTVIRVIDLLIISGDSPSYEPMLRLDKMEFKKSLLIFEEFSFLRRLIENHILDYSGSVDSVLTLADYINLHFEGRRFDTVLDWAFPDDDSRINFINELDFLIFEILYDLVFRKSQLDESDIFLVLEEKFGFNREKVCLINLDRQVIEQVCALAIELVTDYEYSKAESLLSWYCGVSYERCVDYFKTKILPDSSLPLIRAAREGGAPLLERIWIWFYGTRMYDSPGCPASDEILVKIIAAVLEKRTRLEAEYLIDYYIQCNRSENNDFRRTFVRETKLNTPNLSSVSAEFLSAFNDWPVLRRRPPISDFSIVINKYHSPPFILV